MRVLQHFSRFTGPAETRAALSQALGFLRDRQLGWNPEGITEAHVRMVPPAEYETDDFALRHGMRHVKDVVDQRPIIDRSQPPDFDWDAYNEAKGRLPPPDSNALMIEAAEGTSPDALAEATVLQLGQSRSLKPEVLQDAWRQSTGRLEEPYLWDPIELGQVKQDETSNLERLVASYDNDLLKRRPIENEIRRVGRSLSREVGRADLLGDPRRMLIKLLKQGRGADQTLQQAVEELALNRALNEAAPDEEQLSLPFGARVLEFPGRGR